jgi:hypothetical protein
MRSEQNRDLLQRVRHGSLVGCPWHEDLYGLRIEAAAVAGDPARGDALRAERDTIIEDDVAPYHDPHA